MKGDWLCGEAELYIVQVGTTLYTCKVNRRKRVTRVDTCNVNYAAESVTDCVTDCVGRLSREGRLAHEGGLALPRLRKKSDAPFLD